MVFNSMRLNNQSSIFQLNNLNDFRTTRIALRYLIDKRFNSAIEPSAVKSLSSPKRIMHLNHSKDVSTIVTHSYV